MTNYCLKDSTVQKKLDFQPLSLLSRVFFLWKWVIALCVVVLRAEGLLDVLCLNECHADYSLLSDLVFNARTLCERTARKKWPMQRKDQTTITCWEWNSKEKQYRKHARLIYTHSSASEIHADSDFKIPQGWHFAIMLDTSMRFYRLMTIV